MLTPPLAPTTGQLCKQANRALWRWRRQSGNIGKLNYRFKPAQNHFRRELDFQFGKRTSENHQSWRNVHFVYLPQTSKAKTGKGTEVFFRGGKIQIKTKTFYNNLHDGTIKVSLTGGYLSRSAFTAISIRMDPDCDYAIRTSILPLAGYPRRRAPLSPDLCFAEMASSWLHPLFLYTEGSSNWVDFLRVSPPSGTLFAAFSVRSFKHAPLLWLLYWLEQLSGPTCSQGQWNNAVGPGQSIQQERRLLLGFTLTRTELQPSVLSCILRQRLRGDDNDWSLWLKRGLPQQIQRSLLVRPLGHE